MGKRDILRRVRLDGYTLTTWDTHRTIGDYPFSKHRIGYSFADKAGHVIFEGEDFGNAPGDAIDSDASLRNLLGFLTLKPGDTDSDYFKDYTPEQMAFAGGDAEMLQMWSLEPSSDDEEMLPAFVDIDEDGNVEEADSDD